MKTNKDQNKQLSDTSIKHLTILHRVLYGPININEGLDYLHNHLREDADLADLGRPLKYQYK